MATIKSVFWLRRHSWRIVVWALVVLCLCAPALVFAQTLTGTLKGAGIGRQVAFSHNGQSRNNWAGVLRLQLDNGPEVPVFCVQLDVRVRVGDRYRSDGPVLALPNGCKIRYLLGKYPASTAQDADEAAARQMAIWVFSDNLDPATIQDATIRDRTIALVTEAQGKPCPAGRTEAPDLTIEPPTASTSVGQVVSYVIRAGSNGAGQTVTVSVNGPAVLSDANGTNTGQQQQPVALDGQGSATIWVLSTGAGQSAVSVALKYRLDAGTVFSPINDNHPTQRLVMAERQDFVANAGAQAVWAGSAPAPSPTPPAQATTTPEMTPPAPATATSEATSPAQATVTPESTAPAQATPTPAPTRRPRRSSPTEQPTAEQPTATALPEQAPTATPEAVAGAENAAPSPTAAQTGAQQAAGPAAQAGQGTAGAAGVAGTAASRPRGLPRTGAPTDPGLRLLLVGVLALLGGWMIRRRACGR